MTERNYEVDTIKGFAIFLVVLGHVILLLVPKDNSHDIISELARMIYTFHMPLFFFMSGYLVFFHPNNSLSLIDWTRKKFMGLIIPYIIFTIIYYYFLHGVHPEYIASDEARRWLLNDLMHRLGSFIQPDSAWFLPVLFELLVLLAVIITIENKMGKYGMYVIPSILLLFLFILPVSPIAHIKGIGQIINYSPFVICGYYINNFKAALAIMSKRNHIATYAICFFSWPLLYSIKFVPPLINKINSSWLSISFYNASLALSGIVLSIIFIKLLGERLNKRFMMLFVISGIYSLEIYLIHICLLNYSCYYHLSLWPNSGIIGVFIGTLLILFASLAISVALSYNKFISRFFFARWSFVTMTRLFKARSKG